MNHPMRRITLWLLSTVSVLVLLFGYKTSLAGPLATSGPSATGSTQKAFVATVAPPDPTPAAPSATPSTPSTAATPTPSPSTSAKQAKKAKQVPTATTVTGQVAQTRWGPVQVQLLVRSGTISKVSVLQYPAGNPRDQEINAYALPILTQETLSAQSARIDMVSGATVTSDGYLQSLQSALDSANL